MRAEDLPSTAEWEIWHQDTFDPDSPRQVEAAGQGLLAGLVQLWARHLFETVQADGRKGFSRFNLWWKQETRSVEIVGDWEGQVRLRQWVYGDKPSTDRKTGDQALLQWIAATHQQRILRGETSAEILTLAKAAGNRQDFEQHLSGKNIAGNSARNR